MSEPDARKRQVERERCERLGLPVPEWARKRSEVGRPPRNLTRPAGAGRGDQKRVHLPKRVYKAGTMLEPPNWMSAYTKAIYKELAASLHASGRLTKDTRFLVADLAVCQSQRDAAAARLEAGDDGAYGRWRDLGTELKSLRAALQMDAASARKGLHADSAEQDLGAMS